ncbi:cytochrome P450 [Actibacterium mucosum KCTC 23349]|uniref:Cytochrome P450 n=1 Tax=Actibacterium mucosum KCTC 23349 TaxID=1454373 RepID=A0A037ZH85_9RHOB|nr:cytochrome P450 [Actibacterium mucosum]KAJ55488.1 cytochrome P450 [Actibacterium mucosum KCTC 23349]
MNRFDASPTDFDFVQNPYPAYDAIRTQGHLAWWPAYDMVAAFSAEAVNALLRDRRFGRECPAELAQPTPSHLAPFYAVEAHSMLELEPPRHTRLRGLVLRAFTSRRIAGLAPEIEALSHTLIDSFPKDDVELLRTYAQRLPVTVIARLLGVPEGMSDDLLRWSNAMVAMYQAGRSRAVENAAARAAAEFSDFLRGYVDARRSKPADDLITHLIAAEEDGEKLSTDELIATCILLLNAGHEATVHTLGNGVKALQDHGMGADVLTPGQVAGTVEEILRYDPPLHMFTRYAYEEVSAFGHDFKRGDQVALMLAAANRDPATWPDAHVFKPTRQPLPNASFGAGLHFCVGAPLARLELQIGLGVLFDRLPNLALLGTPRYGSTYHFHGLEALHVTPN